MTLILRPIDTLPPRILRRLAVRLPNDCWMWQGPVSAKGYGRACHDGRSWDVHRLVYLLLVDGSPPTGDLHHECERPACGNPYHMTDKPHGKHIGAKREGDLSTIRPQPVTDLFLVISSKNGILSTLSTPPTTS